MPGPYAVGVSWFPGVARTLMLQPCGSHSGPFGSHFLGVARVCPEKMVAPS